MDESIDPHTRSLLAEVRLSNTGNLLRSGLFGEFHVQTAHHAETIVVSEMTLLTRAEIITNALGIQTEKPEYYVYIVNGGKAVRRLVNPGIVSGGLVELTSGVLVGDSIIVAGQNAVKEGDTLRVVNRTEN
jgi:hypothetical protein